MASKVWKDYSRTQFVPGGQWDSSLQQHFPFGKQWPPCMHHCKPDGRHSHHMLQNIQVWDGLGECEGLLSHWDVMISPTRIAEMPHMLLKPLSISIPDKLNPPNEGHHWCISWETPVDWIPYQQTSSKPSLISSKMTGKLHLANDIPRELV